MYLSIRKWRIKISQRKYVLERLKLVWSHIDRESSLFIPYGTHPSFYSSYLKIKKLSKCPSQLLSTWVRKLYILYLQYMPHDCFFLKLVTLENFIGASSDVRLFIWPWRYFEYLGISPLLLLVLWFGVKFWKNVSGQNSTINHYYHD